MAKLYNFYEKYSEKKAPLQWLIYIGIAAALVATLIGVLFGVRSCHQRDTIETVEAKYFMGDTVVVHQNYEIKVNYAKTVNFVSYLKKKGDSEKTILQGEYIEVNLDVTKSLESELKNHKLDANDFKLRNHSGVYLPLNTIMAFFDIDMVDVHIDTDENGFVMSTADFSNKNAIKDYSWVGTELKNGETINVTLFFNMKEGYKVEEDLMLLEVDFYTGYSGIKKGEDIVLLYCDRQ